MDSNDGLEEKIPGVNADSNDAFFHLSRQTRGNSQCSLSIETSFQGSTRTRLPPKIGNDNLLQHSGPALKFPPNQVAINSSFPSLTVHGTEIRPQSSDSSHFGTHGHPIESANGPLAEFAGFPPRRIDEEDDLFIPLLLELDQEKLVKRLSLAQRDSRYRGRQRAHQNLPLRLLSFQRSPLSSKCLCRQRK